MNNSFGFPNLPRLAFSIDALIIDGQLLINNEFKWVIYHKSEAILLAYSRNFSRSFSAFFSLRFSASISASVSLNPYYFLVRCLLLTLTSVRLLSNGHWYFSTYSMWLMTLSKRVWACASFPTPNFSRYGIEISIFLEVLASFANLTGPHFNILWSSQNY